MRTILFSPPKYLGNFVTINDCCWGIGENAVTPSKLLSIGSYLKEQGDQVRFLDAGMQDMAWGDVWNTLKHHGVDRLLFQVVPQFESWQMIVADMCFRLGIEPYAIGISNDHEKDLLRRTFTSYGLNLPTFDKFPPIDWSLIGDGNKPYHLTYQIADGCPYHCSFCIWSKKEFAMRPPELVIKNLEQITCSEPIYLLCAQITTNKKWLEKFVELKKEYKLDFKYTTDLHCKEVTDEKIEMLVESGCIGAVMGVESTNQDILDKINKGITIDEIENAVLICKKEGLDLAVPFLYNIDPSEDVERDIEFYKQYKSFTPSPGIMKRYPGTQMFEETYSFDHIMEFGTDPVATMPGLDEALKKVKKWEGVLGV